MIGPTHRYNVELTGFLMMDADPVLRNGERATSRRDGLPVAFGRAAAGR
jgi:hypothetical protein